MSETSAGFPLRVHLIALALLMLLPAISFSALLIVRFADLQHEQAERGVVQLAAQLAEDIDREHERNIVLLRSLALSLPRQKSDFSRFHAEARTALAGTEDTVLVLDAQLSPLVNSGIPWGSPLSAYSAPETAKAALLGRKPVVSGLFFGKMRQRQVVNVLVPVIRGDAVEAIMVLAYAPERLDELLPSQRIGRSWATAIADRQGTIVARSSQHPMQPGQQLPPEQREGRHRDGLAHLVSTAAGQTLVRATARTRIADWLVEASVEQAMLDASVQAQWRDLLLWGAGLLGIALTVSLLYGRSIERPLRRLVESVTRSGVPPLRCNVREISEVARLLSNAVSDMRDSEERFRSFTNEIDQVIWFQDGPPGYHRYVSPAYATIWGRSPEELQVEPRAWLTAVHAEDRERIDKAYLELLEGRIQHYDVEYRIVRPDGDERWIRDRGVMPIGSNASPNRIGGIADDITQAKMHERKLERYRVLLDRARDIKLVLSCEGIILEANNAAVAAYGYTHDELLGLTIADLRAPDTLADLQRQLEMALSSTEGVLFESVHRRKDGSMFPVEASACAVMLEGESIILSVVRDITARRVTEAALARQAERQRVLLGLSNALIAPGHDEAELGRIVFERISGPLDVDICIMRRFDEQGSRLQLVFEAGLSDEARQKAARGLSLQTDKRGAGTGQHGRGRIDRLAGTSELALVVEAGAIFFHPLLDGDGELVGTLFLGSTRRSAFTAEELIHLQSVTSILALTWQRLAAERTVRQSELRLRIAAQSAKLAYVVLDLTGRRVWLSDNFSDVVGYAVPASPPAGLPLKEASAAFLDHIIGDDRSKVQDVGREILGGKAEIRMELKLRCDDGNVKWQEATWRSGSGGTNEGNRWAFATLLDITERKKSEERVRQLMREVNHRSNNLLSVVLSIARHMPQDVDCRNFVETLSQRIRGLAASQDLLVRSDWHGVVIADLVLAHLAFIPDLDPTRVSVSGPAARLTSTAAQAVGMALHELATNAVRHGALSNSSGSVTVTWEITSKSGRREFRMAWLEQGGPHVAEASSAGFGTLIMGRMTEAAVRGSVSMSSTPAGIQWTLDAPVENVIEGASD